MNEKKEKSEKLGAEDLVQEVKIAGYVVRPWSFGKVVQVTQHLDQITGLLSQSGVKVSELDEKDMGKIAKIVMPVAPLIMAITLDVDKEEIEKLKADDGILIMLTIVNQNIRYLKNFIGPVVDLIGKIVTAITDTLG